MLLERFNDLSYYANSHPTILYMQLLIPQSFESTSLALFCKFGTDLFQKIGLSWMRLKSYFCWLHMT